MTYNPLHNLKADIEAHWREFLPTLVADLEAEGRLEIAIAEAVHNTEQAVHLEMEAGADFGTAWETCRNMWAFLTPEPGTTPVEVVDAWEASVDFGWPPDDDNRRENNAV